MAPIDYCGWFGRLIRHHLLTFIDVGQPILVLLQRRRTPFMNKWMRIASFFGTEDFFTAFIIFLQWCVNARLARLYTILMSLAFYTVGFCKVSSIHIRDKTGCEGGLSGFLNRPAGRIGHWDYNSIQ